MADSLFQLPISAWPYGRVVILQPTGLSGVGNGELVQQNFRVADRIQTEIGLSVEHWPGA
jgi:hypothetical protein